IMPVKNAAPLAPYGPTRYPSMPMNGVPACCSATGNVVATPPARASSATNGVFHVLIASSDSLFSAVLVREWPESPLFLGNLPQTRQPMRLDDQKEDDQAAEYEQLGHGCNARIEVQVEYRV